MDLDQRDEAVETEVSEGHDALIVEALDPDEAVLGSLSTRSMVLTWDNLVDVHQSSRTAGHQDLAVALAGVSGSHRLLDPVDRLGGVNASMQRSARHQSRQLVVQCSSSVMTYVTEPLRQPEASQRDVAEDQ